MAGDETHDRERLPAPLDRGRHVDLTGRRREPVARRAAVIVLMLVIVAALLNLFGQRHSVSRAQGAAAALEVQMPSAVRGGLFFQSRIEIRARTRIERPTLILGDGWTEQMQLNTIEPSPAAETSAGGRLQLRYDALKAGDHLTIWIQFEANPTGAGRRDQSLELLDGEQPIARVARRVTVFP